MKLQDYLKTYDGNPITIKELANALGFAEGTVRNRKKVYQEAGIVFHHGNTGMVTDQRDLEALDNRNAYTLPASPRLYKSAAVFVAIELKEPPLFLVTPATYKASIGKGLTIRCACSYIRRCIAHPDIKPRDKTLLEDTLALAAEARLARDTLALVEEHRKNA